MGLSVEKRDARRAWRLMAGVYTLLVASSVAAAGVDLELRPEQDGVGPCEAVRIGLYAIANEGANESMSGLDVVLGWDKRVLQLTGYENNPGYSWLLSGFLNDDGADGLNTSFADGDALFQAIGQFTTPAVATQQGFLITVFEFKVTELAGPTTVRIEPSIGAFSRSQVFRFGAVNEDMLEAVYDASLTVAGLSRVWISDVSMLAGREASVYASGEIGGDPTFGVTLLLELVPRAGNVGTVSFTPAPPVDVLEAGDPWPVSGTFTPFDTNLTPSVMFNGSTADNGTFMPTTVAYCGPLVESPVQASANAAGIWDVRFPNEQHYSGWEGVATVQTTGVLRIVSFGDGDGGGAIDLQDFSELWNCLTGASASDESPIYDRAPELRCGVYDHEGDGDIDLADFAAFQLAMQGTGQ